MKVLVVANNKGGVAKTTTARMLCEWYSRRGDTRVLALDMDPQCSLSLRLLKMDYDRTSEHGVLPPIHEDYDPSAPEDADWDGRSSIADIYYGQQVVPYPTTLPNVDVAPGHGSRLNEVEYASLQESQRRIFGQLRMFLTLPEVAEQYDLAIVDTPPKKGQLSISAVRAATHIVIPSEMEQQSVEGLQRMLLLLKRENIARPDEAEAKLAAIIPVKFRETKLHREFLAELAASPSVAVHLPPDRIPNSIKVAETDIPDATPPSMLDLPGRVGKASETVCQFIHERVFTDG